MERGQRDGGSRPNPWHQKRGGKAASGDGSDSKRGSGKRQSGGKRGEASHSTYIKTSEAKFEEAKSKMEEAVKKHMVAEYESSDEEEDIQVDPILGKFVLKPV